MFYKISMVLGFLIFGSCSSFAIEEWVNLEEKICSLERNFSFNEISGHYTCDELKDQQNALSELSVRSKLFYRNIPAMDGQLDQENCYKNLCKIGGILEQENNIIQNYLNSINKGDFIYPEPKKRKLIRSLQSLQNTLEEKQKLIIEEIGVGKKDNTSLKYNHITPKFRVEFLSDVKDQRFDSPTTLQNDHLYARRDAQCKFLQRVIFG